MLEFLRDKASERKLRLFACACCRKVWHLLKNESSQRAVEEAERFAEGLVPLHELDPVYQAADEDYWLKTEDGDESAGAWMALTMLHELHDALHHAIAPDLENPDLGQPVLLRDIFGNPFRPVTIDSTWLTSTVLSLAQAAYANRDLPAATLQPDRLGVLADALEEAGAGGEVVAHLRGPGPHVRGCFVLDLLLGKE
jgi:hypothetical protein